MNDLQLLLTYCWAHPKDRASARGLCDEYMSHHGVSFMCAARETYRLRRNQRNRDELAAAAKCIARGTEWAPMVQLHILNAAGQGGNSHANIILVAGSRPPQVKQTYKSNPGAFWYETTILVGARWVIGRAEEIVCDMMDVSEADSYPAGTGTND